MKKAQCFLVCGVSVGLFILATNASAQIQFPEVTASTGTESITAPLTPGLFAANGEQWMLNAPVTSGWLTVRELRFKTDPIIYGNVLIQNTTATPQIYTVSFTLPTILAAPNLMRGSVDTSVIGTDATVAAIQGFSIYTGVIDGVAVAASALQPYPFSLYTPQAANSSFTQFGWVPNSIAVGSSIGIVLRFNLSPGDSAAIISDFEVVPVPEPGSLALMLLGGVLVWIRQRK